MIKISRKNLNSKTNKGSSTMLGRDNRPNIPINANIVTYTAKKGKGSFKKVVGAKAPYKTPSNGLLSNYYYRRLELLKIVNNISNKSKKIKTK